MIEQLDDRVVERIALGFRALSHPTRVRILGALRSESSLSPNGMLDIVGRDTGLPNVAYHTRELAALGLLTPAGRRPVRGALEHFYALSRYGRELLDLIDRAARCDGPGS